MSTFVGSSGRVFPAEMKAAPLLRAWLAACASRRALHPATGGPAGRRRQPAVHHAERPAPSPGRRHPAGPRRRQLGRLGSDGAWVPLLAAAGLAVAPLQPANCGFVVASPRGGPGGWSEHLASRFAGQPSSRSPCSSAGDSAPAPRRGDAERRRHRRQPGVCPVGRHPRAHRPRRPRHGAHRPRPGRSLERVQAEVTHPAVPARWPATCRAGSASPASRWPCCGNA